MWSSVSSLLTLLAIALPARTAYKMSDTLIRSVGAVYRRALRQWIFAGMTLLAIFCGKFYGIEGVVFGVSMVIILNFIIMLMLIDSILKLDIFLIFKSVIVALKPILVSELFWLVFCIHPF